ACPGRARPKPSQSKPTRNRSRTVHRREGGFRISIGSILYRRIPIVRRWDGSNEELFPCAAGGRGIRPFSMLFCSIFFWLDSREAAILTRRILVTSRSSGPRRALDREGDLAAQQQSGFVMIVAEFEAGHCFEREFHRHTVIGRANAVLADAESQRGSPTPEIA